MTQTGRFVAQLVGAVGVALLLSSYPVWKLGGDRALFGLVAGAIVSTANCAGGFYFLRAAMGRSAALETAAVLGGFVGRLLVAITILFICRSIEAIDTTAMGVSIVAFYFLSMIIEVRFLFKHVLSLRPRLAMKEATHRVAS
ncbi:MAG: hypothetical protein HY292_08895 [Planctomycetes bacterium]|nr:hypothetical protein [Planctomycetota bacterium]